MSATTAFQAKGQVRALELLFLRPSFLSLALYSSYLEIETFELYDHCSVPAVTLSYLLSLYICILSIRGFLNFVTL
jgi:hypothetical protein